MPLVTLHIGVSRLSWSNGSIRFERPQLIDPGDRFETFDPAPVAAQIEPTATLHALLDRLERGIARRPQATSALDQTLGHLTQLAS